MLFGWGCAVLAVVGIPGELEALFLKGMGILGLVMLVGIPVVWKQKHLEALVRFTETEGLYQRLDDARARDLHDTFMRLSRIQLALNGLTRDYHVKGHSISVAEEQQQRSDASAIKAEMRELEGRMVLEYGVYEWEMLSALHLLEQCGFTPDEALIKAVNLGCSTVADIDEIAHGLHRMMKEVGPHVW